MSPAAADSSVSTNSPRATLAERGSSSPCSLVSRASDRSPIESPEVSARPLAAAWNVPASESQTTGSVMNDSWPALSDSIRASPKSSSSESLVHEVPPPSPKQSAANSNSNSIPNHATIARQKSLQHSAGGSGEQAPPPTLASVMTNSGSGSNTSNNKNRNLDHGGRSGMPALQPHSTDDHHHRSFTGNRRGNNNSGGFVPHHNNYGHRREQDRGGHEWNHRNFNSRDVHMQPLPPAPRGVRPYLRPHLAAAPQPFLPPLPMPPFGGPMGYPDMPSPPMYYIAGPPPFVAHPPPPTIFFPPEDPQRAMLMKQIEYYFSYDNLCRDEFLRRNMDDQGWVPISLIAGFNMVKKYNGSIQYILDTMRSSSTVEVQGDKIRKRNEWMHWILPTDPKHLGSASSAPQSPAASSSDNLSAHFQNIGLEEATNQNNRMGHDKAISRSASGNLSHQVVRNINQDVDGQNADQMKYARSLHRSDTL